MKYSTNIKIRDYKNKIIDIILFPIRVIGTPVYDKIEKRKRQKKYSEKEIKNAVQYLIDYWTDSNSEFYIILDGYSPFDGYSILTPFDMYFDMSNGWYGEHKKIKNKIRHIYHYQNEQYLNAFKQLCKTPMTLEEKKEWFNKWDLYKIKDKEIYKIK